MTPPLHCQIQGCTHLAQTRVMCKEEIWVCLYHFVLLHFSAFKKDDPSRKISET